jgi:hypothetical protein
MMAVPVPSLSVAERKRCVPPGRRAQKVNQLDEKIPNTRITQQRTICCEGTFEPQSLTASYRRYTTLQTSNLGNPMQFILSAFRCNGRSSRVPTRSSKISGGLSWMHESSSLVKKRKRIRSPGSVPQRFGFQLPLEKPSWPTSSIPGNCVG